MPAMHENNLQAVISNFQKQRMEAVVYGITPLAPVYSKKLALLSAMFLVIL